MVDMMTVVVTAVVEEEVVVVDTVAVSKIIWCVAWNIFYNCLKMTNGKLTRWGEYT